MKTLLNRWFIAGCACWLVVQITRRSGHPLPFANNYLTDLVAIPVIANLALWFMRKWIIKSTGYILSAGQTAFICLYLILVFEILLPHFKADYTGDWRDALCYVVGSLFFYTVMNRPLSPK